MFYDLNVVWSANDSTLPQTLAFLQELGYNVVALNHQISGKLAADISCPIPHTLPKSQGHLTVLRRCTLSLTHSHQNARLAALSRSYDILALRPVDEATLQLACKSLDCDIISLDLTQRLPFWFKHKLLHEAIKSGKRFEICYASGIGGDAAARRNLISNTTQLIRASRGRGLIISSEAKTALGLRGPWDAVNLTAVWGLGQERGYEAISKECRSVVVAAQLKRTSYRGVVDVVYGGEKPIRSNPEKTGQTEQKTAQSNKTEKRKADVIEDAPKDVAEVDQPLSKRAMKRLKKAKSMNGGRPHVDTTTGADKAE